MGARCIENLIEVTDDYNAYYLRTGAILYYKKLEWLGFKLDNFSGLFHDQYVAELLTFCKEHPSYHIVTMTMSGYYENRYVPDKRVYHLAEGDKNPNLVLNVFLNTRPELFMEEGLAKALAIVSKVDRGHKAE